MTTIELRKPIDSPPKYVSVLMTEEERYNPLEGMTGFQKNSIASKILHNWEVPEEYRDNKTQFKTIVELTVVRNGNIKSKRIAESSKSKKFDESIEKAIEMAEPFSPFPYKMKFQEITAILIFKNII